MIFGVPTFQRNCRARAQRNGARNRIAAAMTDYLFDHDRLDVYRLSIEYVANAFDTSRLLSGLHRHARDAEHEHEEMPEPGVAPKLR